MTLKGEEQLQMSMKEFSQSSSIQRENEREMDKSTQMHKERVIYLTDYEESFPIAGERRHWKPISFDVHVALKQLEVRMVLGHTAICSS